MHAEENIANFVTWLKLFWNFWVRLGKPILCSIVNTVYEKKNNIKFNEEKIKVRSKFKVIAEKHVKISKNDKRDWDK